MTAPLMLIARIAGERVALPAAAVEAVVEIGRIMPVPRTSPHVAGLFALRSRVLTVIDCRRALEPAGEAPIADQAVVLAQDGHGYALLVESVEDVVAADGPVRALGAMSGAWRGFAEGTVDIDGNLMLVADAGALIRGAETLHA